MMHPSWYDTLATLQDAGLLRDMTLRTLFSVLGVDGAREMDPRAMAELVHDYYLCPGDAALRIRRRRADGYAAVRLGEPLNAMRWLARLIGAAPSLGGVTVEQRACVFLRSGGRLQRVLSDHGWVELADMVDAANLLLATRTSARFVPMRLTLDAEAYVLADQERAQLLASVDLLEPDWVYAFEQPPLITPEIVSAA